MRSLAVAVLFALAVPLAAADKDEDKAKEVAVAFMKAAKAADLDALMKTVDVPFVFLDTPEPKPFEKLEDLKADFKTKLDTLKNKDKGTDSVPTDVTEVLDRTALRKMLKEKDKRDEAFLKLFDKFAGDGGYVVRLGKEDGPKQTYVFVRLKDGKAKVVGTPG